jgi:hypothetical protein
MGALGRSQTNKKSLTQKNKFKDKQNAKHPICNPANSTPGFVGTHSRAGGFGLFDKLRAGKLTRDRKAGRGHPEEDDP